MMDAYTKSLNWEIEQDALTRKRDVSTSPASDSILVSCTIPVEGLGPIDLLRSAAGSERFYWATPSNKGQDFWLAGSGIAAEISVNPNLRPSHQRPDNDYQDRYDQVQKAAENLFTGALIATFDDLYPRGLTDPGAQSVGPRLLGGFSFQEDFVPDNTWSSFLPAHFVVPHYQLQSDSRSTWLTINALLPDGEDPQQAINELRLALGARVEILYSYAKSTHIDPLTTNLSHQVNYPMSTASWSEMINDATSGIETGQIQKVVLARMSELQTEGNENLDSLSAMAYLDTHYDDCYRFLFEARPHQAFFGASPELLVAREGRSLKTMALAGSAARGLSKEEDQLLAEMLIGSTKDRNEHQLVVSQIYTRLSPLIKNLRLADTPEILQLRNIQHLLTIIEGNLESEKDHTVLDLVRLLHPTPALGGVPSDRALHFISDHEPFPRGWYGGPVGWLDNRGNGMFAVGIRSAVIQYRRAWLYAGAGIVSQSKPELEWAETELKFRPLLDAFGVGGVA